MKVYTKQGMKRMLDWADKFLINLVLTSDSTNKKQAKSTAYTKRGLGNDQRQSGKAPETNKTAKKVSFAASADNGPESPEVIKKLVVRRAMKL